MTSTHSSGTGGSRNSPHTRAEQKNGPRTNRPGAALATVAKAEDNTKDRPKKRKQKPAVDGLEDAHKGRSNRVTSKDDYSMLGRGHGFGPHTSGHGRGHRTDVHGTDGATRNTAPSGPERNYGRMANQSPDAEAVMESETYPRGAMTKQGYGSRGRAIEAGATPKRRPDASDEDLKRDGKRKP